MYWEAEQPRYVLADRSPWMVDRFAARGPAESEYRSGELVFRFLNRLAVSIRELMR